MLATGRSGKQGCGNYQPFTVSRFFVDLCADRYCSDVNQGNENQVLTNQSGGVDERGLLEFDLSSIPPSAIVTEATLTLFHFTDTQTSAIYIYANLDSWEETTVTYNNKPGIGPLLDSLVPGAMGTFDTWHVTSSVQEMIDGTAPNYGWQLIDETNDPAVSYHSSSVPASSQRPKLCVTYIGNVCMCGK
jgi:hypothetical protein